MFSVIVSIDYVATVLLKHSLHLLFLKMCFVKLLSALGNEMVLINNDFFK